MKALFVSVLTVSLLMFFGSAMVSADESLVLYFDFEQGPGDTVPDQSQYGNNGEVVGDIEWTDSAEGYGQCISLPGGGPHIKVPDSESLDPTDALTVEAWVRPEEFADVARVIIAHWYSNTGLPPAEPQLSWVLEVDGAGCFRAILNWGGGRADSENILKLNEWQHTAFTWDGSTIKLYLDGVEAGSSDFDGPLWNSEEAIQVARTDTDGYTWNGQLDEVKVFYRALTPAEIRASMEPMSVKASGKLSTVWGKLKVL